MGNIIRLLFFTLTISIPAFAEGQTISGDKNNNYFYPGYQRWKIVNVTVLQSEKTPRTEKEAQALLTAAGMLLDSDVYFARNYFTIDNMMDGGRTVIVSCFKVNNTQMKVFPISSRLQLMFGKEISLTFIKKDTISMPYSKYYELTLEKQTLLSNYRERKYRFDRTYDYYLRNWEHLKQPCKLEKPNFPPVKNPDIHLFSPSNGKKIILKDHNLDPDTVMVLYTKYLKEKYKIDECKIRESQYRYETYRNNRFMFFITGRSFGNSTIDNSQCEEYFMLKKIDWYEVLKMLGVPDELIGQSSFMLKKWNSNNSFTAVYMDYEILFTNIDTDIISIQLISTNQ